MSARTEQLNVLLTPEELEQVHANAAFFAMPLSTFVRHVALGGTVDWKDAALRKRAWSRRKEAGE